VVTSATPERDRHATLEAIKRSDEGTGAYRLARELAPVLQCQDYRNFRSVVEKRKSPARNRVSSRPTIR
jgi:hypothetical protein